MLAAVLAEDDAFARAVAHKSRLHKYSVIRYKDPVKFADNLPELHPDVVIVRKEDFPLHWEIIASELQCLDGMQHIKFILFVQPDSDSHVAEAFRNVYALPDSFSHPAEGTFSKDLPQSLSALLSTSSKGTRPAGEEVSGPEKQDGAAPHGTKSRLVAAAERHSRKLP